MSTLKTKRVLVCTAILSLFIAIVLPSAAYANNDRGRGQERRYERRDDRRGGNYRRDKRKQEKFVNGHDARDGRWDGRGPRRYQSLNRSDRQNYNYRVVNRNQRRYYNRSDQYRTDRRYNNDYYRGANSNVRSRDVIGGILGTILSGQ